jgi:hypothetical protein
MCPCLMRDPSPTIAWHEDRRRIYFVKLLSQGKLIYLKHGLKNKQTN